MLLCKYKTFPFSTCDGFTDCDKLSTKVHYSMIFSTYSITA